MTTGTVLLPIIGAILPDNSTGNKAPAFERVQSSASAPKIHFAQLNFDPDTDQFACWAFRMPTDYASGPVGKIEWKANTTSGNVVWNIFIAAITPGDAETPNEKSFASANAATTAVNATEARRLVETSISLTNADSVQAGDWVIIGLYRDADNGSDTCTANAEVIGLAIEYTGA